MTNDKFQPLVILRLKSCTYELVRVSQEENRACYIGRTMVTQDMWEEVMGYNPSYYRASRLPVDTVSYEDIKRFFYKLNEITRQSFISWGGITINDFTLPTESIWVDCAGKDLLSFQDTDTAFNIGLDSGFASVRPWCLENSGNRPHEVAQTPPNEYGLYDMYGNVWEICGCYTASRENSEELTLEEKRKKLKEALLDRRSISVRQGYDSLILKGGAWNMPLSRCGVHGDIKISSEDRYNNAGFRIFLSCRTTPRGIW